MRVPYLSFTVWIGKLSKVHMPSSARAAEAGALTTTAAMPSAASEAAKERVRRSDLGDSLERDITPRSAVAPYHATHVHPHQSYHLPPPAHTDPTPQK